MVFTLLCIVVSAAALGATIYKWVDQDGVTHYSDQPHPGAQRIDVKAAQTYSAQNAQQTQQAPRAARAPPLPKTKLPFVYTTCEITRPGNDEVFMNTSSVPANVHVEPGLRAGDRISVSLDGVPIPQNAPGDSEFTLTSVVRGTHSVTASVIEESSGDVICQASGVTFNVRQPTILAPNAPQNRAQ